MPFNARKTALEILNIMDKGQQTLDTVLEDVCGDQLGASRRDRALMQALVYGVLRWKGRLDYIISHFSNTRLTKIDPKVLNILRLALFQIIYLDRIPDSAAVNTAVDMTKTSRAPWVVGYVNALLRRAAREHQRVSYPDIETDPVAALAAVKSFPPWIIKRWVHRYGRKVAEAMCDAANTIPPITVRTNTLKTSLPELVKTLEPEVSQIKQTLYSPDGITFVNPKTSIPELNGFEKGWFQVQDEAAQLVSLLLDPQAGETVLDACAGLGGKTGHIAQLMKNKGTIVALDMDEGKLLRLEAEMKRLGVSIVTTVGHNLEHPLSRRKHSRFDRILLDAPCSSLGVMRRNPDVKWRTSKKKLAQFKSKQIRLLENMSHLVKPCGVVVYAVCSPEPEENEGVLKDFLKNHSEFVIDNYFGRLPAKICTLATSKGVFRTFPRLLQMDGFFGARLRRIS